MTDYDDLLRFLTERDQCCANTDNIYRDAMTAINELVAERDDYKGRWDAVSDRCNSALFDLKYARKLTESLTRRAEKVEADLAAARAALRDFGAANIYVAATWTEAYPEHAPAIAAARAEGGE